MVPCQSSIQETLMSKVLQDGTVILDTREDIDFYRLLALRGACRLEALGMKRRGRSALSVVRELYGMGSRAPAAAVVAKIDAACNERRAAIELRRRGA
jgi:hypothetical protein